MKTHSLPEHEKRIPAEQRVIKVVLQAGMVFALLYGAISFLRIEKPTLAALMNFVPAGVLFVFTIMNFLIWDMISAHGPRFLTEMDHVTVFFLMAGAGLMLVAAFIDDKKSEQVFSWAFTLATFVGGYEAGKARHKARMSKRVHPNVEKKGDAEEA